MTEIIPPSASQTTTSRKPDGQTPNSVGEEFNSFIQLLTAQVQNQDPLEPMDSTQFVEQLATFSSLEQQVRSNEKLDSIASMIGQLQGALAGEWLGKEVSVPSSQIQFNGDPIAIETDVPAGAENAIFTIRDIAGGLVWSETVGSGTSRLAWNGEQLPGGTAPTGQVYMMNVELSENSEYLGSVAPRVITSVTDLASEEGQWRVTTAAGITADMKDARPLTS